MKVFLSSTYVDLKDYRNSAAEAIQRMDQQVDRMEVFGARPNEPQVASLESVEGCDIFVGIYAHRYGYIPPGSEISITEAEFRRAKERERTILCFVVNGDHPWPPSMIEDEPGKTKLRALKTEIGTDFVTDQFTTPDDLAIKIATSLGRYLFGPLVSGLKAEAERNSRGSADDRRAVAETLATVEQIGRRTLEYIAQKRRSSVVNRAEEIELARGWEQAGIKLIGVGNTPNELVNRYLLKAEYWSDPELWTDDRIEAARIGLEEIREESRKLLLGLPNN